MVDDRDKCQIRHRIKRALAGALSKRPPNRSLIYCHSTSLYLGEDDMPKKLGSTEKKVGDKKAGGSKGGQKTEDASDKSGKVCLSLVNVRWLVTSICKGKGSLKAATAVNVRHILCEKHSKATEALQKIQVSFPLVLYTVSLLTDYSPPCELGGPEIRQSCTRILRG